MINFKIFEPYYNGNEKLTSILIFLLWAFPIIIFAQAELIMIEDNGKYGYISEKGEVVIPPKFREAFPFRDTLAKVREQGKFGVINRNGEWVYPPIYDKINHINSIILKGWRDGKEEELRALKIKAIANSAALTPKKTLRYTSFKNKEGAYGVKRNNGELILKPKHFYVQINKDHLFTSWRKNEGIFEYALLDTLEQILIPYGKYASIRPIGNNWVYVKDLKTLKPGLFNILSKSYYPIQDVWSPTFYREGSEGIFPFSNTRKKENSSSRIKSYGFMDTTGQVLFKNDLWTAAYTFDQGVAMVEARKEKTWYLLNRKGEKINQRKILDVVINSKYTRRPEKTVDFFYDDWTFVRIEEGIAKMNRRGEVILIEELKGKEAFGFLENRFLLIRPKIENGKRKRGGRSVYDVLERKLLPIYADNIKTRVFDGNSFMVEYNDLWQLINADGESLWSQKEKTVPLPYDVSEKVNLNMRKKYPKELHWIQKKLLHRPRLFIGRREKLFKSKYEANNLYVLNPSKDTLVFGTNQNRIQLLVEAQDTNGVWKTVNDCPGCKNGKITGQKELPPGHYWYYRFPKFKGYYKTRFRATLSYYKKDKPDKKIRMKKKFKGGINLGQLNFDY